MGLFLTIVVILLIVLYVKNQGPTTAKTSRFPPTPYGFIPPKDADVRSWACADPMCDTGKHGPNPRDWPRSCPECGSGVVTGVVAGKYAHAAERLELDFRMKSPRTDIDLMMARRSDILWRYRDAAIAHDMQRASQVRAELESALASQGDAAFYMSYGDRLVAVWTALDHGLVKEAAAILLRWYEVAPLDERSNGGFIANIRALAECTIKFLKDPLGSSHPAASVLWDSLSALMAQSNDIATADMNVGYRSLSASRGG